MKPITFKIFAGTAAILGIVLGYLDRKFAPTYLVTSDSPAYPEWLGSFAWWIASGAAIAYFVADIVEHAQQGRAERSQVTSSGSLLRKSESVAEILSDDITRASGSGKLLKESLQGNEENRPNKAPEPTPGAVTPRASEGDTK